MKIASESNVSSSSQAQLASDTLTIAPLDAERTARGLPTGDMHLVVGSRLFEPVAVGEMISVELFVEAVFSC